MAVAIRSFAMVDDDEYYYTLTEVVLIRFPAAVACVLRERKREVRNGHPSKTTVRDFFSLQPSRNKCLPDKIIFSTSDGIFFVTAAQMTTGQDCHLGFCRYLFWYCSPRQTNDCWTKLSFRLPTVSYLFCKLGRYE